MLGALLVGLNLYFMKKRLCERKRKIIAERRRARRRRQFERVMTEERVQLFYMLTMTVMATSLVDNPVTKPWSLPKSDFWWRVIVNETFAEEDWRSHFRMTRHTFEFLCTKLRPSIRRLDTRLRSAIGVEQRVAITLWRLSTNIEYRTLAQLFGVGTTTVCCIVHQVISNIWAKCFWSKFDTVIYQLMSIMIGDVQKKNR